MSGAEHWFETQPDWFKTAVFYELHTRAFFDSSDDGNGDFRGLRQKLDYLQWLGIDCIWILPFYPSPLRDGGYDISDFLSVSPEFGTTDEFAAFVESAHERGMRQKPNPAASSPAFGGGISLKASASPPQPPRGILLRRRNCVPAAHRASSSTCALPGPRRT